MQKDVDVEQQLLLHVVLHELHEVEVLLEEEKVQRNEVHLKEEVPRDVVLEKVQRNDLLQEDEDIVNIPLLKRI